MTTEQREAENARWVAVQKKAFTHWVNRQLIKRDDVPQIEDLQPDLANGVRLIGLVEILSNRQLEQKWSKKPVMAAHKITNCVLALQHLKAENVGHLTVSAENFVNNDERELPLILGFCWQLLRKYQGLGGNKNTSYEAGLLEWLRSVLKDYDDINLDDNYKSHSFQDGKVWLGLINEFRRGVIDYKSFSSENKIENCSTAFRISEEQLNIPSLIDPIEMAQGKTSDKNIVLYLSLWYNAFKEQNSGISREELARRIAELEENIRRMMAENEELRRRLASGIDSKANQAELDMQEIIRMLEELMKLRDGMKRENQELAESNRKLREKLERENREREQLERILCEKMEKEGGAVVNLRQNLEKHVERMHEWRIYLNQQRTYDSIDLNNRLELDINEKSVEERVGIVDKNLVDEVSLLDKLLELRKKGITPSYDETTKPTTTNNNNNNNNNSNNKEKSVKRSTSSDKRTKKSTQKKSSPSKKEQPKPVVVVQPSSSTTSEESEKKVVSSSTTESLSESSGSS